MFKIGDAVEWRTGRGGNRLLSGVVIAVVPAYVCAYAEIRRRKLEGVVVPRLFIERPNASYIVDIGASNGSGTKRYRVPLVSKLRMAAHG